MQIGGNTDQRSKRELPLFGSPREFHVHGKEASEPTYVDQRFEEADLLPVLAMAMACKTLPKALTIIFEAFRPHDASQTGNSQASLNREGSPPRKYVRPNMLIVTASFARAQFERGFGTPLTWDTDESLMHSAKLDLDALESLKSSKVIGLFGFMMNPNNIIFQQEQKIGVFNTTSRDYISLSQAGDFFEAGIEYSNFEDPTSPLTAEPIDQESLPPGAVTDGDLLEASILLPANIHLLPLNSDQSQEIPQKRPPPTSTPAKSPPLNKPESPSFFSASFAEHLTSSNRHGPRIDGIQIPLNLAMPTRSQSYPTTPSPVTASQFSIKGRSSTLRSMHRTSKIAAQNIVAIHPPELIRLLTQKRLLVLDIRAYAAYAKSRVRGAINVCIPTVLLKRPSLSLGDISESIVSSEDRGRFGKWKEVDGIVIYDTDSLRVKEAYPLATLAAKFLEAGFDQQAYGVTGSCSPTPFSSRSNSNLGGWRLCVPP